MVTTDLADQQLASLHGNQVAYQDNRSGSNANPSFDIYVSTFSFGPDAGASFSCGGFESPMDGRKTVKVKKNRVLPLKAQLLDGTTPINNFGITAPPAIQVLFVAAMADDAIDVTNEALSAGAGTEGNQFQFEFLIDKWQFNLKTKNYSAPGTYTITMESGDTGEYLVDPTCSASFIIE